MRLPYPSLPVCLVLSGLVLLGGPRPLPGQQAKPADTRALARKLVTETVSLRAGNVVLITGGVEDARLLEDLAIEARALGAHPLITIGSDRLDRLMYDEVPPKFDTQIPQGALKLAGLIDASINVDYSQTSRVLDGVSPERIAARGKAGAQVGALLRERRVQQVFLGNDLAPTAERAERFGITQQQLAGAYWSGIDADYEELAERGRILSDILVSGREIRITHPNGTDLTVRINDRDVYVTDGSISAADIERGGAATAVWLPAGEVFLAPVPGSAKGTVVADRHWFQGKPIEGLRLEFENGKLVSMTARSGLAPLKAFYDAAGGGKDEFSVIDIGMNPSVTLVPGSRMVAWMAAGMVTVGLGNNIWAGGENDANFAIFPFLPGSTLAVDGTILVKDGQLATGATAGGAK